MSTSVTVELPQLGGWFFCSSLIFQIKPPTFKVSLRTISVLQSAVFSFTVYTLFAVCQSHLLWSFSRANPCTAAQCLFLGVNFWKLTEPSAQELSAFEFPGLIFIYCFHLLQGLTNQGEPGWDPTWLIG